MIRLALIATLCLVSAAPALADAIDGEWCSAKNHRLTIRGPRITTPSGTQMEGTYSRHAFSYIAPEGDADANADVQMQLLNEDTLKVERRRGGAAETTEIWRRCQVVS